MSTIYAVVRLDKVPHKNGCHVYTKTTSNVEKMQAYAREIAARYPTSKIMLLPRDKAQQMKFDYWKWYDKYELAQWRKAYNKAIGRE